MQILNGVFHVAGPPYGTDSNSYAILGKGSIVMIDVGLDLSQLKIIDGNLSYWELKQYPISHVFLTHSHFDHSGNACEFRKRGAKIVAGCGDAEGIELGDDRTLGFAFGKKFTPCPVDIKVKDGDVINAAGLEFEAIHVPGHTQGSMFYKLVHKGKILLFTGDTIIADNNCSSAELGWNGSVDYDKSAYLESIKKVKDMKVDVLLGGHKLDCLRNASKLMQDAYKRALLELR